MGGGGGREDVTVRGAGGVRQVVASHADALKGEAEGQGCMGVSEGIKKYGKRLHHNLSVLREG